MRIYRKFFFDTEFMEDGRTIDLLSIGCVSEDGERQLYACNREADLTRANAWVQQNVIPKLPPRGNPVWQTRAQIRDALLELWFGSVKRAYDRRLKSDLELWAYYSAYDWVVLCQLFGRMVDLPPGMPMFCMDLKMLSRELGDPRLPVQSKGSEHNALDDALWAREGYIYLKQIEARRTSL